MTQRRPIRSFKTSPEIIRLAVMMYFKISFPLSKKWDQSNGADQEFQLQLLRALETGDAQQARGIMAQHMAFAEKLMQQQELRVEWKFGDLWV